MHAILKPSHTNRGQISQSKLNRVSGLMRTQITRVQDHHRSRLEAADGNHPLVRLVYSFLFSPHQEPMAVYEWAVENEVELAQAVGFSNSIQHRNPLESVCYPDCDEYWVTHRPSHCSTRRPLQCYTSPTFYPFTISLREERVVVIGRLSVSISLLWH